MTAQPMCPDAPVTSTRMERPPVGLGLAAPERPGFSDVSYCHHYTPNVSRCHHSGSTGLGSREPVLAPSNQDGHPFTALVRRNIGWVRPSRLSCGGRYFHPAGGNWT